MILKRTVLLILILGVGCNQRTDNSTVDNNSKKNLADRLDGYWLSDSYLTNISNSRSIYTDRDYRTKFWGFTLNKENLMSDSAYINGFTIHEGGYGSGIKYDSIKNCFIKDLSMIDEYSFIKEPFKMTLLDSGHLELDFGNKKEIYRKVNDDQTELRKLLFEGQFRDIKTNKIIEFSADGTVGGLDKHKYFELVYDFGEGIFYDASIFYPNQDSSGRWTNGDMYHFKINSDTLKLYKITPDWDMMDHKIGDLEYLLVKS